MLYSRHIGGAFGKPRFSWPGLALGFARDDRGAITIMTVVWFLMLFVFAGIGFEIARQDEMRTRFQAALDRGVLAAANLSRDDVVDDASARAVVEDFLRAAGFADGSYSLNVSMTPKAGGRLVQASAIGSLNASIFKVMGVDNMAVPAVAAAEEVTGLLEIVLVLDVSASMTEPSADGGTKLSQLQAAAKTFVDTVLTPENIPRTLISIVPYSAQVNLSDSLAAHFRLDGSNPYENCIDYFDHDFTSVEIDPGVLSRPESQHFLEDIQYIYGGPWWNRQVVDVEKTFNCPSAENATMEFSNDPVALKAKIDGLTAESWTASYMGMKIGAALLDRGSVHGYVEDLVHDGALSSDFEDWPASYNSRFTKKIIVLMTDGVNTELRKIEDGYYANHSLDYWDTTYDLSHEEMIIDNLAPTVTGSTFVGYWCSGWGWRRRCRPRYEYQYDYTYPGDAKLYEICNAFKANPNTVIYAIGYEVSADSQAFTALSGCATNAATSYLVEGVEISTAFANIANDLEILKLIR